MPDGLLKFEGIGEIAGKIDLVNSFKGDSLKTFITVMFTFLFVDFFDTVGTLVGVCSKAKMLDKDGKVPNAGRALLVDAIGTTAGALMGVSTVTTYVESATGVAEGGKTGYTSITVGILFIIAMFFSPIFVAIPGCATAPALIFVGFLMISAIVEIDLNDLTEAIPAYLCLIGMPLFYSISEGIVFGVVSYVVINVLCGKAKKSHRFR